MNKLILTVLLLISAGVSSASTPDDLAYKNYFDTYYALVSISNTEAVFNNKASNVNISVKAGDTLAIPLVKHSKTIYTIRDVNSNTVKIHYKSTFDARSFGDKKTEINGDFIITKN